MLPVNETAFVLDAMVAFAAEYIAPPLPAVALLFVKLVSVSSSFVAEALFSKAPPFPVAVVMPVNVSPSNSALPEFVNLAVYVFGSEE